MNSTVTMFWLTLGVLATAVACSNGSSPKADSSTGGHSPSETGGALSSSSAGNSAQGGSAAMGGSTGETTGISVGGAGSDLTAGGSATGGFVSGGTMSGDDTGGTSTGGSNTMGGSLASETGAGGESTGGVAATGGTKPNDTATGGISTGGVAATGGSKASDTNAGGKSTGGVPATGGSTGTRPPMRKFVGNITTAKGQTDIGDLHFKDYWNQVTPQNEGKWGEVSKAKGQYDWTSLDTLHDYAKANNMIFKQHTFIWGAQQPTFTVTEDDVKDWMTEFCARYTDVAVIDVVNEPPPHRGPSYANAIGGGTDGDWAWIANAFRWAREACPKATLVLNDYNNIEWDQDNAHFISIVNAIKKLNAPIDAIGCQSHDLDHTNSSGAFDVDLAGVTKRLNALIAVVPNIYITELDMSTKDDAAQLKLYQTFWPLFWDSPNVKGITIWGWVVGKTWNMAPDSGLITTSGTKRPAFTWLLQQIEKG